MTQATRAGSDWGTPEEREGFRRAYEELKGIVDPGDLEPYEVVETVERYRRAWQPERTRTLLLAESHVQTDGHECHPFRWTERVAGLRGSAGVGLDDLPAEFVRLVYCLAYGENQLLQAEDRVAPNAGTVQFWKLFHACCHPVAGNSDFAPILKTGNPDPRRRLAAKLDLLATLRDRGIWLADASILGLYKPGAPAGAKSHMAEALAVSWRHYISTLILANRPRSIVVTGKGVFKALERELTELAGRLSVDVSCIPQPQARTVSGEEWATHYAHLFGTCSAGA